MRRARTRSKGGITRRDALGWIGVGTLAATLGGCAGRPRARPVCAAPPNIVLIMADDLGYGDVGCYGAKDIRTPALDRIAAQGVRLTDYYCAAPWCAPTRVSIMTGRYPQRTSLPHNPDWTNDESGLAPEEITIAEVLRNAGYRTGLCGKWHLGYAEKFRPLEQGFDEYWGFLSGWADYYTHRYRDDIPWVFRNRERDARAGYMTELITEEALAFIRRYAGMPFFLYVAYSAPHWPLQAPEEYERRSRRGTYGAMVECMDAGIGRILDDLERRGLSGRTLLVFASDNGADSNGSNGLLRGGKAQLTEGGIRVPALVRWPGVIAAGSVCEAPLISMDWFATFARAGGGRLPEDRAIDARSLVDTLRGRAPSPHEAMYWHTDQQKAMREGPWKLFQLGDQAPQLYRLDQDAGEEHDLAAQYPDRVAAMQARWEAWRADVAASA